MHTLRCDGERKRGGKRVSVLKNCERRKGWVVEAGSLDGDGKLLKPLAEHYYSWWIFVPFGRCFLLSFFTWAYEMQWREGKGEWGWGVSKGQEWGRGATCLLFLLLLLIGLFTPVYSHSFHNKEKGVCKEVNGTETQKQKNRERRTRTGETHTHTQTLWKSAEIDRWRERERERERYQWLQCSNDEMVKKKQRER